MKTYSIILVWNTVIVQCFNIQIISVYLRVGRLWRNEQRVAWCYPLLQLFLLLCGILHPHETPFALDRWFRRSGGAFVVSCRFFRAGVLTRNYAFVFILHMCCEGVLRCHMTWNQASLLVLLFQTCICRRNRESFYCRTQQDIALSCRYLLALGFSFLYHTLYYHCLLALDFFFLYLDKRFHGRQLGLETFY